MTRKADGTWDKTKLPSRHVAEDLSRAPHRSYYYAMGLGTREINQPFVGVASCWNEAAPCNTALMRQAHAVSVGVKNAGATPREFCTITVTDGGSILPGRWQGRDVTVVDVFEGVGMHSAGRMSLDDLCKLEAVACPGDGACGGQFPPTPLDR